MCRRRSLTSVHQIVELQMCALSNRIREEPNWWEMVKNEAYVHNRREQALAQEGHANAPSRKLNPGMYASHERRTELQVNYVLEELLGYASLRDPATGIEVRSLADIVDRN